MAYALVQEIGSNSSNSTGDTTNAITAGTAATANNLLIVAISWRGSPPGSRVHTGWTEAGTVNNSGNASGGMYYRIATGDSNDDWSITWTGGRENAAVMTEYSGNTASPYDSNIATATGTTSSAATSAVTPGTSAGAFITVHAPRANNQWNSPNPLNMTNSFVEDARKDHGGSNNSIVLTGRLNYATGGSNSTTWSTTDSGGTWANLIATFAAAGGAGPTPAAPPSGLALMGVGA